MLARFRDWQPQPASFWYGAAAIVLFVAACGIYAIALNRLYYAIQGPFFDSLSYLNALADVRSTVSAEGLLAALRRALELETVVLPWVAGALTAPFTPLTRSFGTWFQVVALLVLGLSLYRYFVLIRGLPVVEAVIYALPFLAFQTVFHANGGLSDFRMDLLLYTFCGIFAVWLLTALETGSRGAWIACGLALGLGSLCRATMPVYVALMFGPLLAAGLMRHQSRGNAARGLFWITAGFGLVAGVPYALKFEALYYYYAVWNIDANMKLPWSESRMHLFHVPWHVGWPLLAVLALSLAFSLFARRGRKPDVATVWMALAAPLFLMMRGAGPNPFVSMPAVFGVLMFGLLPWRQGPPGLKRWPQVALCTALLLAIASNAYTGIARHREENLQAARMEGYRELIRLLETDAMEQQATTAAYAAPFIGRFHVRALQNVMLYDAGWQPERQGARSPRGVWMVHHQDYLFAMPVRAGWEKDVPGNTSEEKLDFLVQLAGDRIDYLIVPVETSLEFMEKYWANQFIHGYTREFIRRVLGTGRFRPLGGLVVLSPQETVQVYVQRGVRHTPVPGAGA